MIVVYLNRQKKLDVDPKAIQQVEYVGQLKNVDDINFDRAGSMIVLTILEKIKKNIKILSSRRNSITNDGKISRNTN